MTNNEKEAIERLSELNCDCIFFENGKCIYVHNGRYMCEREIDIQTALNLIQKQQKEIEHQLEKRNNQKEELAILNEKQKEFNKLTNTVKSYKGQLKRQQEEIEKYKMMLAKNNARALNTDLKQMHKHEEDLEALHLGWKEEA